MIPLTVHLNGDGAFAGVDPEQVTKLDWTDVALLDGGMQSGLPSVALLLRDDRGRPFFAETSWRLLLSAVQAMNARLEAMG